MVNRTINYETNPPAGDWIQKATFLVDAMVPHDGSTSAALADLSRPD